MQFPRNIEIHTAKRDMGLQVTKLLDSQHGQHKKILQMTSAWRRRTSSNRTVVTGGFRCNAAVNFGLKLQFVTFARYAIPSYPSMQLGLVTSTGYSSDCKNCPNFTNPLGQIPSCAADPR